MSLPESKKYIVQRAAEIIRDYLYDSDESYCRVELYFEKRNGENQHKQLTWGKPSEITPDKFRNEPYGFDDIEHKFPGWIDLVFKR